MTQAKLTEDIMSFVFNKLRFIHDSINIRNPTISSLAPRSVDVIVTGIYSGCHFHADSCCHGNVHGGHSIPGSHIHAGKPSENHLETVAIFLVHPTVDGRVVASVAHGQPVTSEPQVNDIGQVIELGVLVSHHHQRVKKGNQQRVNTKTQTIIILII
ncbi:hypothetical protein CEXT_442541 [Caerostris extrusa]|uniref:Uncharacterized protein n=1 Tax=Caerostris extrusa TaxID=172846 RepID=A0AAV4PA24_CAEEX|nr:hypothetical protein CEXT_442541 [Caerostris extrusa]